MSEKITFTVNGIRRTVQLEGKKKAIDLLREDLNLTGTKRGCDDASCGACVIVIDGVAKKSCVLPAGKLDGTEVVTVEGMARGKRLHPIQSALIEAGAVQCGYCMPGIIMELFALFLEDPAAEEDKILDALDKHLCRCTGYEAILKGALLAREKIAGQAE